MIGKLLIYIIRVYQLVFSSLIGNCCRFYPSCSAYSITAISRYGSLKGVWLSFLRICRCNPFNMGGADPVPDK